MQIIKPLSCFLLRTILFITLLLGFKLSYAAEIHRLDAVPTAPSIDWMADKWAEGQTIPLSWHLYWGVPGTRWEVMANNQSVFKSSNFDSTTANTQSAKTNLTLSKGRYSLIVKLCNESGCADSAVKEITVGAGTDSTPTAPQVSFIGSVAQGGLIPVKWNMWWGEVGSAWEVWIDSKQVHTSNQFLINQPHTQAGEIVLSSTPLKLQSGNHDLVVKLCNGSKCGQGAITFSISGTPPSPDKPGKPIISKIPDSTSRQVTLNWSMTGGIKGTSWYVTDTFNGSTSTVFPSSTVFNPDAPANTQAGTAALSLANGTHSLIAYLCNGGACTASDAATANVLLPPTPTPGVPALDPVPNSTAGKLSVNWATTGEGGSYWELWNGSTRMETYTVFGDAARKKGNMSLDVPNGTYVVSIKLCNDSKVCSTSNAQTATISGAPTKSTFFMSYYPTWFAPYHNAFCDKGGRYYDYDTKTWLTCTAGSVLPDKTITSSSLLAGGVPNYVTHVVVAFAKLNLMRNYTGLSMTDGDLKKLGLDLTPSSASIKESIRVLKKNNPGTKVILALGGASFNESWKGVTDADVNGAAKLIVDLGLDGLDVDYEVVGTSDAVITEYYNSIAFMRKAVDKANQTKADGKAILTVPGWSTGADCTRETQGAAHPGCSASKISFWGGNAGRERLVMEKRGAASMFDLVAVMSYDASYEHYDPITAYNNYRQIVKPGTPVALGIQPSPDEGWGGARTMVNDRGVDNDCVGNTVLQDQYNVPKPGTFSVQRFAAAVKKNPGDGIMMWSLFASRAPSTCGSVKLSTVTELGQAVSQMLGVGNDRTKQIDYNTAINYGRY